MTLDCIACGMPMEAAQDHAMGDPMKPYCRYCMRPDGSMQSYDEKLAGYAGWLVSTQGLDGEVAQDQARTILAQFPAWRTVG
jgi:hypothetical protein